MTAKTHDLLMALRMSDMFVVFTRKFCRSFRITTLKLDMSYLRMVF